MKKMIARAGFLLLAAVLCSLSSFAYDIGFDETPEASSNTSQVSISVVTAPKSIGFYDVELINWNTGETILNVLDFYVGERIIINLEPGNYELIAVSSGAYGSLDFTVYGFENLITFGIWHENDDAVILKGGD